MKEGDGNGGKCDSLSSSKFMYICHSSASEEFGILWPDFYAPDGEPISMFPSDVVSECDCLSAKIWYDGPLGDCVSAGAQLIVSDRFREIADQYPHDLMVWMKVDIVGGRQAGRDTIYWVAVPLIECAVWDMLHSEVEYYRGTDVIWRVINGVIDPDLLPNCDIFFTKAGHWIISHPLADAIRQDNLLNVRLTPIPVGTRHCKDP